MSRINRLEPEFVEEIPRQLEPGKLYISIRYTTALHLCCCGCGAEVVTSLHPIRWSLTYDGETVSLSPSIGSWSLPCQSHYFITRNNVRWASKWPKEKIEAVRKRDRAAATAYFDEEVAFPPTYITSPPTGIRERLRRVTNWSRRGK